MSRFKWSKKSAFNALMVVTIVAIFICMIMAVGALKGWFEKDADWICGGKTGAVFIERDGIAYALKDGTAIRDGDLIETKEGGQISLLAGQTQRVVLNGQTKVSVSAKDEGLFVTVLSGEVLGDSVDLTKKLVLVWGENQVGLQNAVASLSVQAGSQSVCVFTGTTALSGGSLNEARTIEKEQSASILENGSGDATLSVAKMAITSLNDFQIVQLQKRADRDLCFSQEALKKVQTDRTDGIKKAQQAALDLEDAPTQESAASSSSTTQSASSSADSKASGPSASVQSSGASSTQEKPKKDDPEEGDGSSSSSSSTPGTEATLSCTIEIRCDTILDNLENLDAGKDKYVPADGEILSTVKVKFAQGDTVFDVLKKACSKTGIALEYSWTPMYNSYYVEGINHLYEFDCGSQSGWMYQVNGWFPNYGCSSYTLEDGDVIVWSYTCKGLGADIGGSVY